MMRSQHNDHHSSPRRTSPAGQNTRADSTSKRARAAADTEEQQLCPQQRYTKRPKHPGMATFDGTLRKLPIQGSKPNTDTTRANRVERGNFRETIREFDSDLDSTHTMSSPDVLADSGLEESLELSERHLLRTSNNDEVEYEVELDNTGIPPPASDSAGPLAPTQSSPLPHTDSNTNDNFATLESLLLYPRTLHLQVDTKMIYVHLTTTNASHGSTMTASSGSELSRKLNIWRGLQGLRHALAQDNHDFFHISQDASAPDELRRLAARYSTTTSSMKVNIHDFMRHLHSTAPPHHEQMLTFLERAKTFLETFELTLPSRLGWATISDDLHLYLHALLHAGLPGHCVYACDDAYTESPRWQQWTAFQQSSLYTLDDALREWYCQRFLPPASTAIDEVEELYRATQLALSEPVLGLLSGWLCFGPRIARTFQHFIKAFTFLAWFGATR